MRRLTNYNTKAPNGRNKQLKNLGRLWLITLWEALDHASKKTAGTYQNRGQRRKGAEKTYTEGEIKWALKNAREHTRPGGRGREGGVAPEEIQARADPLPQIKTAVHYQSNGNAEKWTWRFWESR
jgi:hypothetical protein